MPIIRATITLQNPASPYQNTTEALQAIYARGGIKVGREERREGGKRGGVVRRNTAMLSPLAFCLHLAWYYQRMARCIFLLRLS